MKRIRALGVEAPSPGLPGLAILLLVALIPGALIAWFAFEDGGFFVGPVALVAAELIVLLALRFAVGRVPWEGYGVALVTAIAALGGFAAWTLASQGWSHAPARAMGEYDLVLLYLVTLAFFGSFAFSVRRTRWMAYGVAAAIVGVCAAAFVARTLPEVIAYTTEVHPERLSYPLTYWNALGIFAAVGLILCGHFACSTRDPWWVRVLGAAAIPLLSATLYYTFSRGGTWVAVAGVVLYVLLGRPRALVSGALATAPTAVLALLTVNPASVLTRDPLSPAAIDAGNRIALTVGLCVLGAGVLRAVLLPLDNLVDRVKLPVRARRPILAAATGLGLAVVVAGCATLNVPDFLGGKVDEFNHGDDKVAGTGSSRLLEAGSNGRQDHWDVAKATYRAEPGRGTGAGTFAIEWSQRRESGLLAQNAHSLYYEVLSELGLPGMLMLGAALLIILGAFLVRARGPDRALFAALFAAGLAWAIHAGIDWDWEMPATTLWLFALGGCALAVGPRKSTPGWKIAVPVRVVAIAGLALLAVLPGRMAVSEARMDASLEALGDDDCQTAKSEARSALSARGERALPYQMIGFCSLREGRPAQAARALAAAVERDPRNWELHRDLAITQALAGRDPRRHARRAGQLNPREQQAADISEILASARGPRAWRRAARRLKIHLPGPPTP